MNKIDKAREFLCEQFSPEYREYIKNNLAGDFACEIGAKLNRYKLIIIQCQNALYAADTALPPFGTLKSIASDKIEAALSAIEEEFPLRGIE